MIKWIHAIYPPNNIIIHLHRKEHNVIINAIIFIEFTVNPMSFRAFP